MSFFGGLLGGGRRGAAGLQKDGPIWQQGNLVLEPHLGDATGFDTISSAQDFRIFPVLSGLFHSRSQRSEEKIERKKHIYIRERERQKTLQKIQ